MYSFDSRIRYSEVDKHAELTLESLIDYFQDCSTFQTQQGPATMEYLMERKIAWVLSSWQIEIARYPKLCEEVTIGTVPYGLNSFLGFRNFFMDTKDGERLAVANSVWALLDMERAVPSRITPEILETYALDEKLPMDYDNRKIAIPDGEVIRGEEIVVRGHHLDTNNHVNNGQFVRMAMDSIKGKEGKVTSMRAEYRKQARLGDILYPEIVRVPKEKGIAYTVSLKDGEGNNVCIVELLIG